MRDPLSGKRREFVEGGLNQKTYKVLIGKGTEETSRQRTPQGHRSRLVVTKVETFLVRKTPVGSVRTRLIHRSKRSIPSGRGQTYLNLDGGGPDQSPGPISIKYDRKDPLIKLE